MTVTKSSAERQNMQVCIDNNFALSGRFSLEVSKADGTGRRALADFGNLILDQGLNHLLSNTVGNQIYAMPWSRAHVGASSAPEEPTQVGLQSPIASVAAGNAFVNRRFDTVTRVNSTPTPHFRCVKRYTFPVGVAAGNIAEVGVGWGEFGWVDPATSLFCRALVKDINGEPTVVEVAEDEVLELTYTLLVYVDIEDRLFTMNLLSGAHDGIMRPSNLAAMNTFFIETGLRLNAPSPGGSSGATGHVSADGSLGPATGTIEGARVGADFTGAYAPYVSNSFEREVTLSLPLTQGNLTGGIRAMNVAFQTRWPGLQFEFDPPIPKNEDRVFNVRVRVSLARA